VLLQYLGGGVVYLFDVLYIEDNLVQGSALAANRIGGPAQYVRSTSGDYDLPAFFREAGRTRQSDACSPSGDPRAMRFIGLFMMTSLSVWLASLRCERSFGSQQPPKKIGRPNLHCRAI